MENNSTNDIVFEGALSIDMLDEETWMISEGTGRGRTHCYLLNGDEFAVLIDTGMNVIDLKGITNTLTTKEVYVLNTHGHLDHITNNHAFSKIYMHPDDQDILEDHQRFDTRAQFMMQRYLDKGVPEKHLQAPRIQAYINKQANLPSQVSFTPVHDEMKFDLGGRTLQVISTPGHTPGSICIVDETHRRLYSGDTLCKEGVLLQLPHSCSVEVYLHSLHKIKQNVNRFDMIFSGHQDVPLKIDVLDDFISCATCILHEHSTSKSSTKVCSHTTKIGVSITYSPDKLYEEKR